MHLRVIHCLRRSCEHSASWSYRILEIRCNYNLNLRIRDCIKGICNLPKNRIVKRVLLDLVSEEISTQIIRVLISSQNKRVREKFIRFQWVFTNHLSHLDQAARCYLHGISRANLSCLAINGQDWRCLKLIGDFACCTDHIDLIRRTCVSQSVAQNVVQG